MYNLNAKRAGLEIKKGKPEYLVKSRFRLCDDLLEVEDFRFSVFCILFRCRALSLRAKLQDL